MTSEAVTQGSRHRTVLAAMWTGLAFTVLAALYPFVDRATTHVLADHIRHGYPSYSAGEVDAAVTAYLVILSVVGGLGLISWLVTIRAVRADRGWIRWAAPVVFVAAAGITLAGLTVTDTSGEVGLAPLLGWLLVLPCLAGVVAVVGLWQRR
ncbi:hypothetical protein [Rhodococcus sp. 14C212]|uniref:hypothetical protein n=1 Tax=Rhodococcus sp. 14C212 TaxID=2711209 RepID=UPI0019805349|nr:hypothetical protein [Rhodococcus sp. 14C212]